jgi:nucleotide-binding universal stress UspA family protein
VILAGIDGSSLAPEVVAAAGRVAAARGTGLCLVRVVPIPIELRVAWSSTGTEAMLRLLQEEAMLELREHAAKVPAGVPVSVRVETGRPWRRLCQIAKELSAELMVIGAHGHEPLDHVLGTTAGRVVERAPSSVLVVRGPRLRGPP